MWELTEIYRMFISCNVPGPGDQSITQKLKFSVMITADMKKDMKKQDKGSAVTQERQIKAWPQNKSRKKRGVGHGLQFREERPANTR